MPFYAGVAVRVGGHARSEKKEIPLMPGGAGDVAGSGSQGAWRASGALTLIDFHGRFKQRNAKQ
jgi:hypothetical protein